MSDKLLELTIDEVRQSPTFWSMAVPTLSAGISQAMDIGGVLCAPRTFLNTKDEDAFASDYSALMWDFAVAAESVSPGISRLIGQH